MNIYKLFLYIIFVLQVQSIVVHDDKKLFLQAYDLATQGKYRQACHEYQLIENKGFAVLYNIALVYLHQNDYPMAMVYFKRAEKQANFGQLTLLYELYSCMKKNIDLDYMMGWHEQIVIFWKKCILSISMLLLQIMLLICLMLLIIFWYRRWYTIYPKLFVSILFFCMIIVAVWWYKLYLIEQRIGIVIKDEIAVFAGPDESFYKKAVLYQADELIIMDHQKKYYQVRVKDCVGWIVDNDVEIV